MSRLALKRPKPEKFGALGVAKAAGVTTLRGAAAGGPNTGSAPRYGWRRNATSVQSDGWTTSEDETPPQRSSLQRQQENVQPQQQLQQPHNGAGNAQPPAPDRTAAALTPAAPPNTSQPPLSQRTHPISELYDIYDDSSEGEDDKGGGRAPAPVQPQPAPQHAPAAPTSPGCPLCGSRLSGMNLEQQQQHVNACCDATAAVHGGGMAPPAAAQQRQHPPSGGATGFQRPCCQQQQQPPPPHQQQAQQQAQAQAQQQQQQHRQSTSPPLLGACPKLEPAAAPARQPQRVAEPPPPQQQQQQQQPSPPQKKPSCCKVCQADLSHLGLQEQVTHVKACLAGRGPGRQAKQAAQKQQAKQQLKAPVHPKAAAPQQAVQQQLIAAVQPKGAVPQTAAQQQPAAAQPPPAQDSVAERLRRMDIGDWLQALGLQRYATAFREQELDLTCLHIVTAEELAGIGVTEQLHQARIMQAAAAVAAELRLRRPRSAGGGIFGHGGGNNQQAAPKRQKQLTLQTEVGGAAAPAQQQQQQQPGAHPNACASPRRQQGGEATGSSMRNAGPRPAERALLAALYPPQPAAGVQPAAGHRTPTLVGGRSVARAVPPGVSLWTCTATCQPVAPLLGARLAAGEAEDPEAAAAKRQPLARGGTAVPAGEESLPVKRMRLDALRDELRSHEATVAQLRAMVGQMEREVAAAEAAQRQGGGGGSGG